MDVMVSHLRSCGRLHLDADSAAAHRDELNATNGGLAWYVAAVYATIGLWGCVGLAERVKPQQPRLLDAAG